jgi:hypothetical protein
MPEHVTSAPWEIPYPGSVGEVKLGATDMQEIAERVTAIFKERLTTLSVHGASFTAKSGELVEASAAITITLPAAAANAVVGVLANGHEVTIGAGGALIYGDFVEGKTPIKLVGFQHVVLVSDGVNWFIIAGEPKRETTYGARTERTPNTEYEPNATRMTSVVLSYTHAEKAGMEVFVGGELIATPEVGDTEIATLITASISFLVGPGEKWKAKCFPAGGTLRSSYRSL